VAIEGAVLLKNDNHVLPLGPADYQSMVVMGPTAKSLLVGGGGSAKVLPMHTGDPFAALVKRAGATAKISYVPGYDIEGVVVPASAMDLAFTQQAPGTPTELTSTNDAHLPIDVKAIKPGWSETAEGSITAPTTGDYEFKLQTLGGRGSLQLDPPPP